MDWILLSQDWALCRALVNTLMILKMLGISSVAGPLLSCEERLGSMELVIKLRL
jgi:hypothetical protein